MARLLHRKRGLIGRRLIGRGCNRLVHRRRHLPRGLGHYWHAGLRRAKRPVGDCLLSHLCRLAPRQRLLARFADHQRRAVGNEARDQRNLLLGAAQFVPGDEHAIRGSQLGFAVVLLELLRGKHELARRARVGRATPRLVEGIDLERSLDLDRVPLLILMEEQASAEPAHRHPAGLIHRGVRPNGHQLHGRGELPVESLAPGDALFQVEARAPGYVEEQTGDGQASAGLP